MLLINQLPYLDIWPKIYCLLLSNRILMILGTSEYGKTLDK